MAGDPEECAKRRSFWVPRTETATSEQEGRFRIDPANPAMYHLMNTGAEGPLGHRPGYMLDPRNSVAYGPLDSESDPPVEHPVRSAGASDGTDTLATWTGRDRPLEDTDIVTWYTMGFHHLPRTEDWPVMSTNWKGFSLVPFNFFAMNPAAGIRAPEEGTARTQ